MKTWSTRLALGLLPVLAGAVAAIALVLTPLPTYAVQGTTVGWCGPGQTSDNTVQVALHPDVVNEGDSGNTSAADEAAWRTFCLHEAGSRVAQASIALGSGVLLGAGLSLAAFMIGLFRRSSAATAQPPMLQGPLQGTFQSPFQQLPPGPAAP